MRLSPLDIRQQQFTVRMFRGLDPQEVDAFLADVAEDFESVLKENALLKEQLAGHEERARGLTEIEKTLRDTLVTTQKLADDMKANARRDAELLLREAELRGEKLLEEVRGEEARITSEIRTLRRTRQQFLEDLRATVEMYQRVLESELGRGGSAPEGGGA
jgi:cell division initiation protein